MNFLSAIVSAIEAVFKPNGTMFTTGTNSQAALVDAFTKTYTDMYGLQFMQKGKATTGTNPGTLAEKAMYFNTVSATNNTYTNLGGITVNAYKFGVFLWDQANWSFIELADLTPTSGGGGIIKTGLNNGSHSQVFSADTMVNRISFKKDGMAGGSIKIGTTVGGNEILDTTTLSDQDDFNNLAIYFGVGGGTIYYILTGTGHYYMRFDFDNNFYL